MSDEEFARFWETHSFADFWDEFERVEEPILIRRPKKVISIRLGRELADLLEILAREKGLGYTALIRMWITERLRQELAERQRRETAQSKRAKRITELIHSTKRVTAHRPTLFFGI